MTDALQTFLNYSERYDRSNGKIELKIIHTRAVADIMSQLSVRLCLPPHTAGLAHICAVYHDIGRFEQLKRYDTFLDHISIDHACLGCEILLQEEFLSALNEADRNMVLTAIRNHNKYAIEDGLDDETMLLCRLIRDADKCDIFRVFAFEKPEDTVGETKDRIERGKISDAVYESLLSRRCVRKEDRTTGLDICVSFLAFFYDLYFRESLELLMKNKYYRIPFDGFSVTDPETVRRLDRIMEEVEKYIQERIDS